MANIITHNHTIKDTIYFMYNNKIAEGKVDAVQIFVNKGTYPKITETKISYSISFKHPTLQTNEKVNLLEVDVFATKQELLDSL